MLPDARALFSPTLLNSQACQLHALPARDIHGLRLAFKQYRRTELDSTAACPEDPGSVPSTHHQWVTTVCNASSRDPIPQTGVHTPTWSYTHQTTADTSKLLICVEYTLAHQFNISPLPHPQSRQKKTCSSLYELQSKCKLMVVQGPSHTDSAIHTLANI